MSTTIAIGIILIYNRNVNNKLFTMQMKPRILFLGKKNDFYCDQAVEFIQHHFDDYYVHRLDWTMNHIDIDKNREYGYIISYLCPWVIPDWLLKQAKIAAINFHPGPPEYPGIGCTNFAIYDGVKEFGITCHHMAPIVDSGRIIEVKRFPILEDETVWTLTQKCYSYILTTFYDIMGKILMGEELPISKEVWQRKAYTRKQFEDLKLIDIFETVEERKRRIKATTYPGYDGAYIQIGEHKFVYEEDT